VLDIPSVPGNSFSIAKSFCQKQEQLKLWKHFAHRPWYDPFFSRPDSFSPTLNPVPETVVVGHPSSSSGGFSVVVFCSAPCRPSAVVVVVDSPWSSSSGRRIQNGATNPMAQATMARMRKTNPMTRRTGTSLHMVAGAQQRRRGWSLVNNNNVRECLLTKPGPAVDNSNPTRRRTAAAALSTTDALLLRRLC